METTGPDGKVIEGAHPDHVMIRGRAEPLACAIHRPISPAWVADALARHELAATASNLPATTSDAEVARRELAGGVPTREWPANGAHERNGVRT